MDEKQFWGLIDTQVKNREGRLDFSALVGALENSAPQEVVEFGTRFGQLHDAVYRWDLWGAAYLAVGGCSDDGFDYFCAWLIGRGSACYQSVMSDPDSLVDFLEPEMECEEMMYVADEAYDTLTGEDEFPREASARPREPMGEEWDFDDGDEMQRRFPRLFARVGFAPPKPKPIPPPTPRQWWKFWSRP